MTLRHSTEAELDALTTVGTRLAGFDAGLSAEWIDGYLAALAAGPRVPELDEALPLMLGDSWERVFADPADQAQALAALQARWRVLRSMLDPESLWDAPDAMFLAPLLMEPLEGAGPGLGADWIRGVLDAIAAPAWGWATPAVDDDSHRQAQARLQALATAADDEPTRPALIDDACFALQDLRLWWMVNAPRTAPRRVDAAPGRNDPCPCGSGKKFKKCHGAG